MGGSLRHRVWLASVGLIVVLVVSLGACGTDGADNNATTTCSDCGGEAPGGSANVGGSPSSVGAGGMGAGGMGAAGGMGGEGAWTGVPTDRPLRLLFIGNSFTHQGPIPHLVRDIAQSVGWPAPEVEYSAPGGQSLAFHRTYQQTLALVEAGDWDFVVLQDFSTRPTDNLGDPAGFKDDATWFYDAIKTNSPAAEVVLYETWARHPDHPAYPGSFADPAEMQAQLRFHYNDAFASYIPTHATTVPPDDLLLATVGDAWELHLGGTDPLRLHGADDYHAGTNGRYLNALVLYATLYGVVVDGATDLGLSPADAQRLRDAANATTGITQLPPTFPKPKLAVGQTLQIDFGIHSPSDSGWNAITNCSSGSALDLVDHTGAATGVDIHITDGFSGSNELGIAANGLGYPSAASADTCWVGSFDSHEAALLDSATVTLEDLDTGTYQVVLFASRSGNDGGAGRLTRFTLGGVTRDLEVSDNTSNTVAFANITPDPNGRLALTITTSPAGTSRFGYLGALLITKTAD